MKSNLNRIMIVGTGSGCGKTTVTCALLKTLVDTNIETISFKCGPDYIDPMFHSKIIGTKSRNLDMYMCSKNTVKYLLAENSKNCDIAVIEGVMGMYDGLGFESDKCSANDISRETRTNQIIVVDVKGKSLSLMAELSGFLNFGDNNLKGVILNNCSKAMYPFYKKMIEEKLPLKVCGFLPNIPQAAVDSRHLGLVTAEEVENIKEKLTLLGNTAKETLDLKSIMELAKDNNDFYYEKIEIKKEISGTVNIAVARDKAFCFYYQDNLELLEKLRVNLIYCSPIEDKSIPEGIQGIVLGGGYPEENIDKLVDNKSMIESIKKHLEKGVPLFAECGGFMYLGQNIELDGKTFNTVGAIPNRFFMTKGLVRFGYKSLKAECDNILCKKGGTIKCHEFHYSDTDDHGDGFTATNERGKEWKCIIAKENIFAGYPHLHFWSNIDFARNFIRACKGEK